MEIKLTRVDVEALSSFISKLTSIDKFVYLKINGESLVSSVYLPERDAVKVQEVPVDEIFSFEKQPDKNLKISFFNGSKINEALRNFSDTDASELTGVVECAEMEGELIATKIKISSTDLTLSLACSDPSLGFIDLTSDQVKVIFSKKDLMFDFDLEPFMQTKISSLFNLDKDSDTFKIQYTHDAVRVKGDSFDAKITQTDATAGDVNGAEVMLYKKYFNLLDKESYVVSVCLNKLIFKSKDSNTLLTVSVCSND
jgi:hypothetical protein